MSIVYNITLVDRDLLLEQLWNYSTDLYNRQNLKFDIDIARKQMINNYPDYICGRPIKLDIHNSNSIDPYLYDRENGENAFLNVLERVKCYEYHDDNAITDTSCYLISKESGFANDDVNKEALRLYKELF